MGDLGATYDDHLRLVGKRAGDFLLVLIELSSLGHTAEALRVIIVSESVISLQCGPETQNFRWKGLPPPTIISQKTRINYLLYRIKI